MKEPKRGKKRDVIYDLPATRKKFLDSGRHYRSYGRSKGFNQESFARFMSGDWRPSPGRKIELAYLAALESDGLLVLKKQKKTKSVRSNCEHGAAF